MNYLPEFGWLIEIDGPMWWTGNAYPHTWTKDSLKAIRFARKEDAMRMIGIEYLPDAYATEHMWSGPPEMPSVQCSNCKTYAPRCSLITTCRDTRADCPTRPSASPASR